MTIYAKDKQKIMFIDNEKVSHDSEVSLPNQLEGAGFRTFKLSLIRDTNESAISGRVTVKNCPIAV